MAERSDPRPQGGSAVGTTPISRFLATEEVTTEEELRAQMLGSSSPRLAFFLMLGLSAAIATLGLLGDSAPAIIGAMIVAPLMSPIIGLSFGAAVADFRLCWSSLMSIVLGVSLVVLIAFLITLVFGLSIAGSEILSRTAPSLIDLGIALCAGAAAAFAHSRSSIANSIAGVAIAVALVPPLAVSGIGLALGDAAVHRSGAPLTEFGLSGGRDIALGSFILFSTNILAILSIASFFFRIQNYGRWKYALIIMISSASAFYMILGVLSDRFYEMYVSNKVLQEYTTMLSERPDLISGDGSIQRVQVSRLNGQLTIKINALGRKSWMDTLEPRVEQFNALLAREIGEPLRLIVEVIPVEIERAVSDVPQPTDSQ